jgi:hypothetical protein
MGDSAPLRWRIVARFLGGDMPKILTAVWDKLNGAKAYIGVVITLIGFLAVWIPEAMTAAQADPALITKISGVLVMILGLLHRIAKAIGVPK